MVSVMLCANGRADQVRAKDGDQKPAAQVPAVPQQQHNAESLQDEQSKDIHAEVKIINPPQKDLYDKAPTWINLALVFVALGTGIVIAWQSKETRKSAGAALLNAQAVINAERGRLLFEVEKVSEDFVGVTTFKIVAKNYGRVPVEILGHSPPSRTAVENPYKLPVPPRYPSEIIPTHRFVAPEGKFLAGPVFPSEPEFASADVVELAKKGVMHPARIIFGQIRYMDGISVEPRYSRYCFRLEGLPPMALPVPDGPREYNECT